MNKPYVSVVVPAYNEEKCVSRCLNSLLSCDESEDVEIILVDNNSTDKTREIAEKIKGVKVISEKERGVMHARSRGYKESTGEIIAFLDADCIARKDWIKKIKSIFKDEDVVCACGPYEYYDMKSFQRPLAHFYWQTLANLAYKSLGYVGNFGNMMLRKSTLEKMGGLNTEIVFYGDDTDTARRAKEFGKVIYDRSLVAESSARRFRSEGLLSTTFKYAINFWSQVIAKRSVSNKYRAFR